MITEEVIKEIYKKYGKRPKNADLQLDYFINLLAPYHRLEVVDGDELVLPDLEEFSPFKRFLLRSINAIIEFDKIVAMVFSNHIIFLSKESPDMRVHFRPDEKSLFSRLLGK